MIRQPDRVGDFGEIRIAVETTRFDLRVADVAAPTEGDTINVDGIVHVVQGKPIRDTERLVWTVEARPAGD